MLFRQVFPNRLPSVEVRDILLALTVQMKKTG